MGGEAKPQITRNGVIKHLKKKGFFMEQRYGRMEDQNPGHGLDETWILLKEGPEPLNLKRFPKLSKLGDVVSKLV